MERLGKDPEYVDRFLSVLERLKNLGVMPTQEEIKAFQKELTKLQASQQAAGPSMDEIIDKVKSRAAYHKR